MGELAIYAAVFIGSALPLLEVWIAVPLGVIAGLPWLAAALVGFTGNFITLLPIIYAAEKIKKLASRWMKKPSLETKTPESYGGHRKYKILNKFGVPGLAFLGPFLIGVHAAASFAMAMGISKKRVVFWFTLSLLFCSCLFGFLASLGYAEVTTGKQLPF